MEQISRNVFTETRVRGCNPGFVVTSEGIVLIDTGIDLAFAKRWAEEIAKRGKVRFILNTEHHMDHFVANSLFDGEVVAHQAARDTMLKMSIDFIQKRSEFLYNDPCPIPDDHQLKLPNITFTKQMTIYSGDHTFQLIHTPGHTAGQSIVYIPEEKVAFTGDNVFHKTKTAAHDAVSLSDWVDGLKALEQMDVDVIVPGHGYDVCDKTYLKTQISILSKRIEAEEKTKREGTSLDEAANLEIDPYWVTKDTGIKVEISLGSTQNALTSSKHG